MPVEEVEEENNLNLVETEAAVQDLLVLLQQAQVQRTPEVEEELVNKVEPLVQEVQES